MKRFVLIVVLAGLVAGAWTYSRTGLHQVYLPTATGMTAKQVCSLHFVSGLAPERARALYMDPLLGDARSLVSTRVIEAEARASILGLYGRRAVFREGLGCTLVHDADAFDPDLALPREGEFAPMPLSAAHRDAIFDAAALDAAIDAAFAEPPGGGRNTLAVVVLHDGRLVAERYAEGVTPATPLHGWSMTKSLAATLAGAMVERGEIALDVQAITDETALEESPEKADITLEHLLRMTAGLDITEDNDGTDPNSDMLFTEPDMSAWAARRERLFPPGEHWEYMSGQTVLATARMQEEIPGGLLDDLAGVRERVFEPLDMGSAIIETDQAGNLQGSSYMYAAAQDWARMGQLYLDDGLAPDGTRILPADWDEIVATPTPGSGGEYGMGFWLDPRAVSADAFYMSGFQGQSAWILPQHDLVIVRMGATNNAGDGARDLVADIVASLRPALETPPAEETPGPDVPEDGSPQ